MVEVSGQGWGPFVHSRNLVGHDRPAPLTRLVPTLAGLGDSAQGIWFRTVPLPIISPSTLLQGGTRVNHLHGPRLGVEIWTVEVCLSPVASCFLDLGKMDPAKALAKFMPCQCSPPRLWINESRCNGAVHGPQDNPRTDDHTAHSRLPEAACAPNAAVGAVAGLEAHWQHAS